MSKRHLLFFSRLGKLASETLIFQIFTLTSLIAHIRVDFVDRTSHVTLLIMCFSLEGKFLDELVVQEICSRELQHMRRRIFFQPRLCFFSGFLGFNVDNDFNSRFSSLSILLIFHGSLP